jgi:hypothetical protein
MTFNGKFKLDNVRAVFPKYFRGQEEQFEGKGDAYWNGSWILPRDHPQLPALKAKIKEAIEAKWPGKAAEMMKLFLAKDKLCLHDGDLKASKPYGAAYKGMLFVSARNNAKNNPPPSVFDNVKDPETGQARLITSANDAHAPYSGCYVNVMLNIFGYDQGGGQGVGAQILGVQFREDGERLAGGGVAAADDFSAADAKDVFDELDKLNKEMGEPSKGISGGKPSTAAKKAGAFDDFADDIPF